MAASKRKSTSSGTDVLETYLTELSEIHSSGAATKETSGYGKIENLFNAVGQKLKPKVRCVIQLRNGGAGYPDGGFFSSEQLRDRNEGKPLIGVQLPSRGVIEVKSPTDDLANVIGTKQIQDYINRYGLVLITNYREFILLRRGKDNRPQQLESFSLAASDGQFWGIAAHPRTTAISRGEQFVEYLKRVVLHAAELNNPRDVAFFLASYARDAHVRVENTANLPALLSMRSALEESLGMQFEGKRGEHFFRSTLVQTIFYGLFSAWVLWHKEDPQRKDVFDWKTAAWTLHVPMIKALFEQLATPAKLGALDLIEVLDWTAAALNRVDRPSFFQDFVELHAVQYFYEPFLQAFDPELRKELGVWFTPPEIVQYMVARVDRVLREELNIADGLADSRVYVLDPCCGTGAYLVEVVRRIVQTLRDERGEGALAELTAKEAVQKRVFGFELLPAPFVVAHLQIGLLLQGIGVPLDDSKQERAGIFLTNSLTGWDAEGEHPQLKNWPELESERKGAGRVKRDAPILVVLGNPPYNAFAGVSPKEEKGLVEIYKGAYFEQKLDKNGQAQFDKHGQPVLKRHYRLSDPASKGGWGIKKFNLDDLYVRFFRLAERRIAEKTGSGIVCYISNFSYLADPSFVIMRERFLSEFDTLWFDSLNGDSRETGKLTPDGKPDPSIFSTEYNREGIRTGTAIGLMVRQPTRHKKSRCLFREFWGTNKRTEIQESLKVKNFAEQYEAIEPTPSNRFSFLPSKVTETYLGWPRIPELADVAPFNGPVERRGMALIAFEREELASRIAAYFDANITDEEVSVIYPSLMMTGNRIVGPKARKKVLRDHQFDESRIVRYPFKPYDVRWCYLDNLRPLFSEPSPQLLGHRFDGNTFFITRDTADKSVEGPPFYFSSLVCDYDCISGHARHFPIQLLARPSAEKPGKTFDDGQLGNILQEAAPPSSAAAGIRANLSPPARAYLESIGVANVDTDVTAAALLWLHALAIGYSPNYLTENRDGIRGDWPRIPLPNSKELLAASAALGGRVAELLDMQTHVNGVTKGPLPEEMKQVAILSSTADLSITAGWGYWNKKIGATMPGSGKLDLRGYTADEKAATDWLQSVGESTFDVYLNGSTYWRNIPVNVWEYTIGGYQVLKKWLSYRERKLLGRPLTVNEGRDLTHIARRITALLLLKPKLDKNYKLVKAATIALPLVQP